MLRLIISNFCLMGFCSFILLLHQFWSISKVKYNIFNPNYLRIYCKSDKWVSKIWWPSCRPQDVYIMLAAKISLVAEKSVWIGFWVTQWGDLTWFENWLFVNEVPWKIMFAINEGGSEPVSSRSNGYSFHKKGSRVRSWVQSPLCVCTL